KLSKYSESGTIQRKGTTATSRQSLLVVASSKTDATAGNISHMNLSRSPSRGSGAASVSTGGAETGPGSNFRTRHAHAPQTATNTTRPPDHMKPWADRVKNGSIANG